MDLDQQNHEDQTRQTKEHLKSIYDEIRTPMGLALCISEYLLGQLGSQTDQTGTGVKTGTSAGQAQWNLDVKTGLKACVHVPGTGTGVSFFFETLTI